jgi:hypothetical protein
VHEVKTKVIERPQYQLLKQLVRERDTVVFDSITRMGGNMG